ncbi:hypothetical protein HMY34_12895 [Thiothrix subterranea]|uniref:hypothetical protein n=1 Tax=Thiothrix subterranea TaxID=2735563 RepID=UPI00192B5D29|nr:hypothetical protein [Thiothrix subterranea]QQZ27261.1 hypothetical protein HMY34_12895 [Thiothrix subterranea]
MYTIGQLAKRFGLSRSTLLASDTDAPAAVLERHLQELNSDISRLRQQQQVIFPVYYPAGCC